MRIPEGLVRLREAADSAGSRFGVLAEGAFDPCGLILFGPEEAYPYWCTPTNAATFATTGGDGVHYSYFSAFGDGVVCPIVITVPMASSDRMRCNVVIAESFDEFFSLGYYVGWFSLEQLIYDRSAALSYFCAPDPNQADWCVQRLEFIRHALNIKSGPPRENRLSQLAAKYLDQLLFSETQGAA